MKKRQTLERGERSRDTQAAKEIIVSHLFLLGLHNVWESRVSLKSKRKEEKETGANVRIRKRHREKIMNTHTHRKTIIIKKGESERIHTISDEV